MVRRQQRRKFWKAVQEAAGNEPGSMYASRCHPIWGMRAIRDFEKINGVTFNPSDISHRMKTHHAGRLKIMLAYMRAMIRAF